MQKIFSKFDGQNIPRLLENACICGKSVVYCLRMKQLLSARMAFPAGKPAIAEKEGFDGKEWASPDGTIKQRKGGHMVGFA